MLSRLREVWANLEEPVDPFNGGKESNKHESQKLKAGRGPVGKIPVAGARDRGD